MVGVLTMLTVNDLIAHAIGAQADHAVRLEEVKECSDISPTTPLEMRQGPMQARCVTVAHSHLRLLYA